MGNENPYQSPTTEQEARAESLPRACVHGMLAIAFGSFLAGVLSVAALFQFNDGNSKDAAASVGFASILVFGELVLIFVHYKLIRTYVDWMEFNQHLWNTYRKDRP